MGWSVVLCVVWAASLGRRGTATNEGHDHTKEGEKLKEGQNDPKRGSEAITSRGDRKVRGEGEQDAKGDWICTLTLDGT